MTQTMTAPPAIVGGRFRPVAAFRQNTIEFLESVRRTHGDLARLRVGPPGLDREIWVLNHPDGAAKVLAGASWQNFSKQSRAYEEVRVWLGDGLLAAEGEKWAEQRRTLQPLFTHEAIDHYTALMVDEIEREAREWHGASVLDLRDRMQRLTLRVVVRALFGESAEAVIPSVRESFPVLQRLISRRSSPMIPLPASVPTPRVLRGRAARADLLGACDEILAARRDGRAEYVGSDDPHEVSSTDLLARLLTTQEDGRPLTDAEIRDQILVFLLAGHETTSTALTFALHLIGNHPEVQDRVRAEADAALSGGVPHTGAVAALPCTAAVMKETMRLYPSAPVLTRLTVADDEILGHRIPRDVVAMPVIWNIHRHPDFWPDPERFDPERFVDEKVNRDRHRYAWMPFSGGPRGCIGQYFSMLEATLALALFTRDHRFESTEANDRLPVNTAVTLFALAPVLSRVTPRNTPPGR